MSFYNILSHATKGLLKIILYKMADHGVPIQPGTP
jgi:hypothetical protein